jgi:hypothetical protein
MPALSHRDSLSKLAVYIDENIRVSKKGGLPFVDTRGFQNRLLAKQNHIVFGRRGAGKTSLVNSLQGKPGIATLYVNLEDYKDISFPNILIKVLTVLFRGLADRLEARPFWWLTPRASRLRRQLHSAQRALQTYLSEPDREIQDVTTSDQKSAGLAAGVGANDVSASANVSRSAARLVKRSIPRDKLDYLKLELSDYKELLNRVTGCLHDSPVYFVLDDFYFVQKQIQPSLIDYLHRLTKDTDLYLKVATIKHRSKLYSREGQQTLGVELGSDALGVDLDYTLDQSGELEDFMRGILGQAATGARVDVRLEDLFAGDGFSQLCLASGGVPRDFLSLFAAIASRQADPIGVVEVREAAIANRSDKIEAMKTDAGSERAVLEDYLSRVRQLVYGVKRTNVFLIAKLEMEADDQLRQAIRELVDLRLLHLVDQNTSRAPGDGRFYEAYMLDVSLYENARPRNFHEVQPGRRDEHARMDDLRAAPVVSRDLLSNALPEPRAATPQRTGTTPRVSPEQLEISEFRR